MVSAAKIASNRRNAQKSSGPKSVEGKAVSRFNALQHGLTAKLAMLPDEDPAAFEARRVAWLDRYQPRDEVEVDQVEDAVYMSWQLQRASRARSAQLCFHAQTAATEKQEREVHATIEMTHRLLRPTWDCRWGGSADKPAADAAQTAGIAASYEEADHPAILGNRLETIADGCRWIWAQFTELAAILDQGRPWTAIDCFKATRLFGMQPASMVDLPELADFLGTCQAVAGASTELATETWNLLAPPGAERGFEQFRDLVATATARLDAAGAHEQLRAIVQTEIERLELKIEAYDEAGEVEAELGPHRCAYDPTEQGERMLRYEFACRRFLDRIVGKLENRTRRGADRFPPAYDGYSRLRPSLLRLGRARRLSAEMTGESIEDDHPDIIAIRASNAEADSRRSSGTDGPALTGTPGRNEANEDAEPDVTLIDAYAAPLRNEANGDAEGNSEMIAVDVTSRRNEANGVAEGDSEMIAVDVTPLRNEPNGVAEGDSEMIAVDVTPLRNEANGIGGTGSETIAEDTTPHRNEANGDHEAEARSLVESGAAGRAESPAAPVQVMRTHQVGCVTVTKLSKAVGLPGTRPVSRRRRRAQLRAEARRGAAV
jgi:hypothetical protein